MLASCLTEEQLLPPSPSAHLRYCFFSEDDLAGAMVAVSEGPDLQLTGCDYRVREVVATLSVSGGLDEALFVGLLSQRDLRSRTFVGEDEAIGTQAFFESTGDAVEINMLRLTDAADVPALSWGQSVGAAENAFDNL